jgi:hypothetical protein
LPATNICTGAVYKSTDDTDYQKVLGIVNAAVQKARQAPRRDMQNLVVTK